MSVLARGAWHSVAVVKARKGRSWEKLVKLVKTKQVSRRDKQVFTVVKPFLLDQGQNTHFRRGVALHSNSDGHGHALGAALTIPRALPLYNDSDPPSALSVLSFVQMGD